MTKNAMIISENESPVGWLYGRTLPVESGSHHLTVRFDDGAEVKAWSAEGRYKGQRVIVEIDRHTEAQRTDALRYGITLPELEYRIVGRLAF